jgi:DNA-binding protein HU-beta
MNKKQFTAAVAERTGSTQKAAEETVNAFFGVIGDTVATGEPVAINGFGTFSRVQRPARDARNPATGETVHVPATNVPKFKVGATFKAAVKNRPHDARSTPVNRTTPPPFGFWRGMAIATLVAVVAGIIAVAFRGSWGALRDAALAAHFDGTGADLYPFAVDGLLIIAIIAGVLLRHDAGARRYCLGILIGYTGASWLINYLHGLGLFTADPATHVRPGPPWPVVMLIAALLIGSIFLGSHLLIFVWRHIFPDSTQAAPAVAVYQDFPPAGDDVPPVPELPLPSLDAAKFAYSQSLHPTLKPLSQAYLMNQYRLTKREAAQVQSEVKAEQAEPADVETLAETVSEPSLNGSGPA